MTVTITLNLPPETLHAIRNTRGWTLSDEHTSVVVTGVIAAIRRLPPNALEDFLVFVRMQGAPDSVREVNDEMTVRELERNIESDVRSLGLFEGSVLVLERTGEVLRDGGKTCQEVGIRRADVLVIRAKGKEGGGQDGEGKAAGTSEEV